MQKADLRDVLELVKQKLSRDVEAACGLLWADSPQPTTRYSIGEEDASTEYAVGEEDASTLYGFGEEDGRT